MSLRRLLALLVLVLASASARAQEAPALPALPSPECLRAVRVARISERAGNLERAEQLLTEAMEANPDQILPLQELLRLHEEHELSESRAAELRQEIGRRVRLPDYPLADGSIRFLARELDTDTEVMESLLAGIELRLENRKSIELLSAKAQVQERLRRWSDSRETIDELLALEDSFRVVSAAVLLELRMEEWQAALELVEPRIGDPHYRAALDSVYVSLLAKTGQTERAMAEISRRDSEGRLALVERGYTSLIKDVAWSLYDAGKEQSSEQIWRMLIAEIPEDVETRLVLANLFSTEEERREQTRLVDEQVSAVEDLDQLLSLGTEYLAAGDPQRAFDTLKRVADSDSEDSEVLWFNLGLAAYQIESWEEAVTAFRRSVLKNADRAEAHSRLAMALVQLERCEEAVPAFQAGLELEPERTNDYYYLGNCLAKLGDRVGSAKAMDTYHRLRDDG